ncbi:hypothetical protein [Vibrio owensii]|uniref:hypothetical protein n=1 Tax=Vibrio owensii TaxID=696485 RepID=UPI0038CE77D2
MVKKRGLGLVQFRKNLEKIKEMHHQGYPVLHIYNEISESIEIKKSQFYELFDREIRNNEKSEKKKAPPQTSNATPNTASQKSQQVQPEQKSNTNEKPKDPFRRKSRPLHNPNISDEEFKNLIG